jgi:hypothetical protein
MFGGQTYEGYDDCLFVWDLKTEEWTEVPKQGILSTSTPSNYRGMWPKARHGHACCVWESSSKMVLFGGRDGFEPAHFANDLWFFDFNTLTHVLHSRHKIFSEVFSLIR